MPAVSILQQMEDEDIVIYSNQVYSNSLLQESKQLFETLVNKGEIQGEYYDNEWNCYSGVNHTLLNFTVNESAYNSHIGKLFNISSNTMGNMLRCYAIYCNGVYIYDTIQYKINAVKRFMESYSDNDYLTKRDEIPAIEDFLLFISTPDDEVEKIFSYLRKEKADCKRARKLSPVINYLVIEDAINNLYKSELDDITFFKYFPIYFWVNITFILPLRATEMLLTPYNCISTIEGKKMITVRRSLLKKHHSRVYYDVEKDYKAFTYLIPENRVSDTIEKYINLTSTHKRKYLFDYNEKYSINKMMSLVGFNQLLADFFENYIKSNSKYEYAKYATNIDSFEIPTAGDSRHIAMSNLYFQKNGADICRQLADHVHIDVSSNYYTNVTETIFCTSVMRLQNRINYNRQREEEKIKRSNEVAVSGDKGKCISQKRLIDLNDISDCESQECLENCFGCSYYRPTKEEVDEYLSEKEHRANAAAKEVIAFMNNSLKAKKKEIKIEDLFLEAQTQAAQYKKGADVLAEEREKEWLKLKNTMKTSC